MYQSLSVVAIETQYADRQIILNTSFDVDPSSVNEETVQVISRTNNVPANVSFNVVGKDIIVTIDENIVPNTDYIIRATGIKNVLGETMKAGIRRKVVFKSSVREIPVIVSPSNYEEITDLKVTLKAILEDKEYESLENKSYFIQIARDVAFIDIVLESTSDEASVNLQDLRAGQYYIRARIESYENNEKEYGKWSETTSFISLAKKTEVVDEDAPVFIQEVALVDQPVNGETPNSILLEFSGEIDSDFIDNIVVIRRDI